MKTKRYLSLTILLFAAIILNAAPRSKQAITKAAMEILNSGSMFKNRAPRHDSLVVLKANEVVTIMGYRSGGFAVIGNDDRMPAVLAYSEKNIIDAEKDSTFRWFMNFNSHNPIPRKSSQPESLITPSEAHFPSSVQPFVKAHWRQWSPYNNMCPVLDSLGHRAMTGCVATAMAEIIRYNKYPLKGQGTKSIIVRHADNKNIKDTITVDFAQSYYDYDKMLDSYDYPDMSDINIKPMAKLMLDCGVACEMNYGLESSSASATDATAGLIVYFGYTKKTKRILRKNYEEEEWLKIMYNQLSAKRALLYTGHNPFTNIGHAFVVDGYDEGGRFSVEDIFYNINYMDFPDDQGMTINFIPFSNRTDTVSINVTTPGELSNLLPDSVASQITALKVSGKINSSDLKVLRNMASLDVEGHSTNGNLVYLDMHDAQIVEGGEPYLYKHPNDSCVSMTTKNDVLPESAFYGSETLKTIILPENLVSIEKDALANIESLDSVYYGHEFPVINGGVYSTDTTELLSVYKGLNGIFKPENTVSVLREEAFKGSQVTVLYITKNVHYIGDRCFMNMNKLNRIYAYSIKDLKYGDNIFNNTAKNKRCGLFTPPSEFRDDENIIKEWYASGEWHYVGDYGINVMPIDGIMGVYSRMYGEDNSKLSYVINYNNVPDSVKDIEFTLNCTLPQNLPVGVYSFEDYPITLNEDSSVFGDYPFTIINSYFYIVPNEAKLVIGNFKLYPGPIPTVIPYTVEGLQNNETEIPDSDWYEKPKFTISIHGKYPVQEVTEIIPNTRYDISLEHRVATHNYDVSSDGTEITSENEMPTGIGGVRTGRNKEVGKMYNILGQPVGSSYRGIVILNGKKIIKNND